MINHEIIIDHKINNNGIRIFNFDRYFNMIGYK